MILKKTNKITMNKMRILSMLLIGVMSIHPVKASVRSYKKDADGVTFSLDKGLMRVIVCKADIIEVKYTIFNSFQNKPSLVVNNKWISKTGFSVDEANGNVIITTPRLKVMVN